MKKGLFGYLPVSLFASVMGLSAMCVAWIGYSRLFEPQNTLAKFSIIISGIVGVLAIISFVLVFFAYLLKIMTSFEQAKNEWQNPLTKVFFGTFCIAVLLLPMVFEILFKMIGLDGLFSLTLSNVFWIIGAILMLLFALHITSFWVEQKHELSHITPAWIVPVVGLLDIPLFMSFEGFFAFGGSEILAKLSLGVGLFFAIVLIPLILARIVFFEKLPAKLAPTLLILLAPFSVGFNAYEAVFGIDELAQILFFIGLFLFIALLPNVFKMQLCCPFRVSWWAISFPLAALCVAAIKLAIFTQSNFYFLLSSVLLVFVSIAFIWLISRTLKGVFNKELANLS